MQFLSDRSATVRMRVVKAASLYFLLVFGTGFVLGIARVLWLVPQLGERQAELLEMPVMLVAIVFAARFVVRRLRLQPLPSIRLGTGFLALALLLVAELLLVVATQDRPLTQYLASRDPVSGSVYRIMLLVFALMPALIVRRHRDANP